MSLKNPYEKGRMFEGASYLIFGMAKELRKNMTGAENALWLYLKGGIKGLKFRRQHPIGVYIADFYCHRLKLIIEINGSIHNKTEVIDSDKTRQKELEELGYTVIRFTNEQVKSEMEVVLKDVESTVLKLFNQQNPKSLQQAEG